MSQSGSLTIPFYLQNPPELEISCQHFISFSSWQIKYSTISSSSIWSNLAASTMELSLSSSLSSNICTPLRFPRKPSPFLIAYSRRLGSFRSLRETSFACKDIWISHRKLSLCRLSCRVRAQNTEACDASDGHHVENDGFVLEDVPHLTDYLPDLPVIITLSNKKEKIYALIS